MDVKRDPRQRPGREPTKEVLDWGKIALVACVPVLLLFLFIAPYIRRVWTVQSARAEAMKIEIIGEVLKTPEGALYIRYLEGKNK